MNRSIAPANGDDEERPDCGEQERRWNARFADGRFRLPPRGVYGEPKSDDGESRKPRLICSPLKVTAYTRDSEGENWGLEVVFLDPDNKEHVHHISWESLAGRSQDALAPLMSKGLKIGTARGTRDLFFDYALASAPKERAVRAKRIGWHGDVFVLPNAVFGGGSDDRIVYKPDAPQEHAFGSSGTIEDWQRGIGAPCVGNSRLGFAVACAFAGPMLEPLGSPGAGFHYRGPSSTGKSTALLAAGSVCGKGYVSSWRTTANALETTCAAHNDVLLPLDELGQTDPREIGDCAYMIVNGRGKARMRKNLTLDESRIWKLIVLSAGEASLEEHIESSGKRSRGGQSVRLVDIPADAGDGLGIFENLHGAKTPAAFADRIAASAQQYYGVPLAQFLDFVAENRQEATQYVQRAQEKFIQDQTPADCSGEVHRVARTFGLVAAAGELAITLRILPWPRGEAVVAARKCFQAWLAARGGFGGSDLQRWIRHLRNFLLSEDARFFPLGKSRKELPFHCAGYKQMRGSETVYYVLPGVFGGEATGGGDATAVARELDRRGVLKREEDRLQVKTPKLPGGARPRAYAILRKFLEED